MRRSATGRDRATGQKCWYERNRISQARQSRKSKHTPQIQIQTMHVTPINARNLSYTLIQRSHERT